MRRSGDVALRIVVLVGVWVVLGWLVGLAVGGTPDATITSAVVATALWFATAGAVALRDGRRGLASPYPFWAVVALIAAMLCIVWQWSAAALAAGTLDLLLLRDDLVVLTPGLLVGAWACAGLGLALGRRDARLRDAGTSPSPDAPSSGATRRPAPPQRPLTTSATRAIHEVGPPRLSSRRSAAR